MWKLYKLIPIIEISDNEYLIDSVIKVLRNIEKEKFIQVLIVLHIDKDLNVS